MKRNPDDKYYTTTNDMIIEDADTEEQMVFLIDPKNRLVIRSLLEEDIKLFTDQYKDMTGKEKREKRRKLYEVIHEKDSQMYLFCIEKIIGEEDKDQPDSIYGLPREPVGIGGRSDEEIMLEGKVDSEIGAFLYEYDKDVANCVDQMLSILAEYLGVKNTQVYFIKKPQK